MFGPIALYKWRCTLCQEFKRGAKPKYTTHYKMSRQVRSHIRTYHPGQRLMVVLKKKTKDGKKTTLLELF